MASEKRINLKSAISARRGTMRFPLSRMIREDPQAAIVISKLHKDPKRPPHYDTRGNREPMSPDIWQLKDLATDTANNINDSQIALQVLPDLELASQILISIVLAPKDMLTVEPIYRAADDITSPDLKGRLLTVIRTYFDDKYKIKLFLQKALRDILFESGSYPMCVIPENSIDFAINGYTKFSFESFRSGFNSDGTIRPLGLLGSVSQSEPTKVREMVSISTEAFNTAGTSKSQYDPIAYVDLNGKKYDVGVRVVDNYDALKIPAINAKARELRHQNILNPNGVLNFSLEAEIDKLKLNDRELTALLFKDRSSRYNPIETIRTDQEMDRMMIGEPLIMHLTSESVIPVFIPGSPDKQIGFFVLLDIDGNPLDLSADKDSYKELSSRMDSNGSFPSAMLQKVKSSMGGFSCDNRDHLNYAASVYGEMIEADLLSRLRNGKYTNGVAIAKKQEIYRIMLARALSNRNTQMLWVPESLMTYFGIRFNVNGIGKSLLDDLKVINSLRAMVTMANVMAMMKNSIARTAVRVKFDPEDPNPQKTLETVMHEVLRSRQQIIPWGTINPADIADWAVRAGLEFAFEGHPGMPDVGLEFEDKANNAVQPNTDLIEELRKQSAMGLGISPETLDAALQPEFATSIVRNNIMMSKRAIQLQDAFMPLVSDHIGKVVKNTPSILNDLLNLVYDGFEEVNLTPILKAKVAGDENLKMLVCRQTLKDFVDSLEFALPRPDSVSLDNQADALETTEKIVDQVLNAYISSDFFNKDSAGEMGDKADQIKALMKAYYMRRFMVDNGIMPEITEAIETVSDSAELTELYKSQSVVIKSFIKNFGKFLIDLREAKGRGDKLMEILGVGDETQIAGGTTGDTGTDSFFGNDQPDGGLGGEDEFASEEPPAEPETSPESTTTEETTPTQDTGETPESNVAADTNAPDTGV